MSVNKTGAMAGGSVELFFQNIDGAFVLIAGNDCIRIEQGPLVGADFLCQDGICAAGRDFPGAEIAHIQSFKFFHGRHLPK